LYDQPTDRRTRGLCGGTGRTALIFFTADRILDAWVVGNGLTLDTPTVRRSGSHNPSRIAT
jgi:hypothetical protein